MILESVRSRLLTGSLESGDRIFCDFSDESAGQKPYIILYEIGGLPILAQDAPVTLREQRVQVSVFGESGISVSREIEKIRTLLHYGKWQDEFVKVSSSLALEESSIRREGSAELYHAQQDFQLRYIIL